VGQKNELYSARSELCGDALAMVKRLAGSDHLIVVLDITRAEMVHRAKQLGIHRVPRIVIDGKLAECCTSRAPDEATLRRTIRDD
jgi:hypothetical protein